MESATEALKLAMVLTNEIFITEVFGKKNLAALDDVYPADAPYSIRINDQWPICFVWRAGDAYDLEIVDYHQNALWRWESASTSWLATWMSRLIASARPAA
jgi:hypothetical protein